MFKSILAGCKSSKALTAVYTRREMKSIAEGPESREANLSLFVDDTALDACAPDIPALLNKLMPAMIKFQKARKRLKLRLSPKAKIVGSSRRVVRALLKELESHGFQFESDKHARDLGISYGAGKIRPSVLFKQLKKLSRGI